MGHDISRGFHGVEVFLRLKSLSPPISATMPCPTTLEIRVSEYKEDECYDGDPSSFLKDCHGGCTRKSGILQLNV